MRIDDIPYSAPGGGPLLADVYLPETSGPWPVVVWVHGGGWRFGSRRIAPDLSRWFASAGLAMVSIDYRLTTEACFPAQIEDVKTAVRWIRANAAQYGFDPGRVGLWGASAGGHLAALAATSGPGVFEGADSEHAEQSSDVQAVVDGYGPIDFLQMDAHRDPLDRPSVDPDAIELPRGTRSAHADSFESLLVGGAIQSHPDRVRAANPITYDRPGLPPVLILHGRADTAVPWHQSEILFEALAARGADVTLCLTEGLGHGFLTRAAIGNAATGATVCRTAREGQATVDLEAPPITFELMESFFVRHLTSEGRRDTR
jgi:acetyl esterase/lipase